LSKFFLKSHYNTIFRKPAVLPSSRQDVPIVIDPLDRGIISQTVTKGSIRLGTSLP